MNIPKKVVRRVTESELTAIVELIKKGLTKPQIAKEVSKPISRVNTMIARLRKNGLDLKITRAPNKSVYKNAIVLLKK